MVVIITKYRYFARCSGCLLSLSVGDVRSPVADLKMKWRSSERAIIGTSIFGVLLSTYALYVEMAVEARPGYKALCDISERASCSRVLSSKYSKGFGMIPKDSPLEVPNCIYGIAFYCLIIYLTTFDQILAVGFQFLLALGSVATSVYLAYLLIFILNDLCVVCVSTYFVNIALAVFVYTKLTMLIAKKK